MDQNFVFLGKIRQEETFPTDQNFGGGEVACIPLA